MIPIALTASLALSAAPQPAAQPSFTLEPASFALEPAALAVAPREALFATSASLFAADDHEGDSPLSYTYVEVGATTFNVDDLEGEDEDIDTYYARASLNLGLIYLFAGYENQDLDLEDTDSDLWRLGVGAHLGLARQLHLIGEIAWLFNDVSSDLDELDESESGYEARAGVRWLPIEWSRGGLELDGNLVYQDIDNRLASDDADIGGELGVRAHFIQILSVGAMYTRYREDDDQLGLNVRFSF
jgi:hypothetical protein